MIVPQERGVAQDRASFDAMLAAQAPARLADPFRELWALGYRRLVPIVPPDAVLSERSSMAARLRAGKDPRGKAVGVRNHDGVWFGFDWVKHEADEADLDRWHAMGAGVGIKTGAQHDGTWLIGIDADTLNPATAADVETVVRRFFGQAPTRIGRAPKALYVVRLDGAVQYGREEFDDGTVDLTGSSTPNWPRVEFLSDGKQFVAHGVHPATRRPYGWTVPLVPFVELPIVPAAVFA